MVLAQWLCAHLIADFILQPKAMVLHKQRLKAKSWMLYAHCLIHGLVFYLVNAQWHQWYLAAAVAITHFFIDWWKTTQKYSPWLFTIDQLLHITVLVLLWLLTHHNAATLHAWLQAKWQSPPLWYILTGYLLLMYPLSMVIGGATQKWRQEVNRNFENNQTSLAEAGKWIGIFERMLVYTFIITSQFAGIGFLITAKSILRFNDTSKGASGRKEAEYILIGTLMSFTLAIITGLLVKYLAGL
ncbi:MAG TPA: DUF3307 domain-containing protein [Phnomibacter sp.]|nr:DUF3307 domain-containing protein [Phnomibacter sp.]